MKVRFSVLIPVYNQEEYVRQTIDSTLAQTFMDYEVIAIDDGSTDQTLQVLESYGTRIRVIRQLNQGPEVARNKAAAMARGEYLVMLDHDDLLLARALEIYDRVIRALDSPPLIIGAMKNFRHGQPIPLRVPESQPVEILRYPDYLSKDVQVGLSNSRIVIRKWVFDEVGGYGNRGVAAFPPDDFNLILKVGTYGPCILVQEPNTVAHREHEGNITWDSRVVADGFLRLAHFENQGGYPGGNVRRWARYAVIGGVASNWALRHCRQRGHRKLALQLLRGTAPMVFAAVSNRFLRYLRKPTQPIVLREE